MKNTDTTEDKLRIATEEFFNANSHDMTEYHVPLVLEVARAFVNKDKKSEKIIRELIYDPRLYDELESVVLPYMGLEKPITSFKLFWDQFKDHLSKIHYRDPESFEKILAGIKHKEFTINVSPGVQHGNILTELQEHFDVRGSEVEDFFRSIYGLNTQIGKNPSGKGEYILDLFVSTAYKSSDVNINGEEFEIKSTGAAVGESLGSKATYLENIQSIFRDAGKEFIYGSFTFGKKDFRKKWAPEFIDLTRVSRKHALELLLYQHSFFMQSEADHEYHLRAETYLNSPSVDTLSEIYDYLCRKYIEMSLMGKSMILFQESGSGEKRKPTGDYLVFDCASITEAVSFAGSITSTPAVVVLPKSSATMRPEILYNFSSE